MKILIGLLLVTLLALNGVLALPARSPNDDAEVISVPRRPASASGESDEDGFTNFKGVIDTGSGYPFLQPHPPPFSFNLGLFDVFDDLVRRLGASFGSNGGAGQDGDSNESGIGAFGFKGFGLDGKKGNTTSSVKVVDGHKVEVNETVYGDSGESFRVRIVNIRPLESGEEVEETVKTDEGKGKEPVTSAPKIKPREDVDDSEERREPLERDNEIRVNPDEQKIEEVEGEERVTDSTLLPSTIVETTTTTTAAATLLNSNEDNSNDNLNAAFVSDNSEDEQQLNGKGNIEAETNKPTDEINVEAKVYEKTEESEEDLSKMLKNYDYDETTTTAAAASLNAEEEQTNASIDANAEAADDVNYNVDGDAAGAGDDAADDDDVAAVQDASLTIENNEKTETNDNFNESSVDGAADADAAVADNIDAASAVEMTKDLNKLVLKSLLAIEEEEALEKMSSTFDEQRNGEVLLVAPVSGTSAIETFDVDDLNSENFEDSAAPLSHANFKKEREHFASSSSSSDDEGAEVEMNPTFNSEWEHLAEELAQTNDQNNDLSNDIDVYGTVPIDLSNDIAVNDIAAAQADFPINPDAEFIDFVDTGSSMQPQFEKLSVSTGYHQQQQQQQPQQPESMEMFSVSAK